MIITCSNCNTKFLINKKVLGNNGKNVKCSTCGYQWFEKITVQKDEKKENKNQQKIPTSYSGESTSLKIFPSEKKEKKNNLYLYFFLIFIIFFFIYIKKDYLNSELKKYFSNFIKKDFFVIKNEESFKLIFSQIEKQIGILNNNQKIIKIFGKLSNPSNTKTQKIPRLRATLFNSNNDIITSWFFYAEQDKLGPQESLNFNTSYIHENEDIADIKIEFYE